MAITNQVPFEVQKTLIGVENELQAFSPIALSQRVDTTINSKYNLFPELTPQNKPQIKYFGIGINGCRNVDDGNLQTPYVPTMKNMDLYTPIPFRCVPEDEDLTAAERSNYRMRVLKTIEGTNYWCYYLKNIEFLDTAVQITRTDAETNSEVIYELDPANLYPIPQTPTDTGTSVTNGDEINVLLSGQLTITGQEIIESVGIMYNDLRRASVSEIGIYTGEDMIVSADNGLGETIQYTEAIYTQLGIHCCFNSTNMSNPNARIEKEIRIGKGNTFLI
jgi:hypothetical protein